MPAVEQERSSGKGKLSGWNKGESPEKELGSGGGGEIPSSGVRPSNAASEGKSSSSSLVQRKERVRVLFCSKCKLIMCKVLMLLKQNTLRGSPGCWSRA